jgi:glycosyltransferase involved in cell wall biosynthesis
MKKKLLIATFDMEVGGVERSLISLLENLDYEKYEVDLMLYRHQGDFIDLIPYQPNVLAELPQYSTFRMSVKETILERHFMIGFSRVLAKVNTILYQKRTKLEEPGYYQMQVMWKYALPFLPKLKKEYDIAISYLWPHYFIADKVRAKKKIAWIHTDYSTVETNVKLDLKMWDKFDHIVAVSDACRDSFLKKYKKLKQKTQVMENLTAPGFIFKMCKEYCDNPMEKDNRFKILTIARLSHAKGIDNAVKTLKRLIEKGNNDIVWYVVGYGGEEEMVKGLIKKYSLENNFILLGKKVNPYPFLKACDLYVQPSRYEGKAVTVTEAKVLGKPILITDYPTAKSQITSGLDGYICDLSVEGLVEGIEMLYKNTESREILRKNLKEFNFNNHEELKILYKLIG